MSNDLEKSILTIKSEIGHIKSNIGQIKSTINKQNPNNVQERLKLRLHLYETLFLDPNKSEELDAYMRSCNRNPNPSSVKNIVGCSMDLAKDFIATFKWDRYR